MVELTRKKYNTITKHRGIIDRQQMATKELLRTLSKYHNGRKAKNTSGKLLNVRLEKIAKIQNILKVELSRAVERKRSKQR